MIYSSSAIEPGAAYDIDVGGSVIATVTAGEFEGGGMAGGPGMPRGN